MPGRFGRLIVMESSCRKPKRKRHTVLFLTETALQGINTLAYIAPNIYVLCAPDHFLSPAIYWCGWVRWTCWNTVSQDHPVASAFTQLACPNMRVAWWRDMLDTDLNKCCITAQVQRCMLPVLQVLYVRLAWAPA